MKGDERKVVEVTALQVAAARLAVRIATARGVVAAPSVRRIAEATRS